MDWGRAGAVVRSERRKYEYWRRSGDFARRCKIGVRTLRALETGKIGHRASFSETTLSAVEDALGWQRGSIEHVARYGGKPRYERDSDFKRIERAWPALPPKVRRMLADVAERALE